MKFDIQVGDFNPAEPARVGNVYPVRGGRGMRDGHMQVLIAITEVREAWKGQMGLFLVITKSGEPIGVNSYGMHHVEELQPIAFVDGLDQMILTMRSL